MANYKVVDAEQLDNDLRSIADTIRAKNGTTEDINFPEGYIAAYESTPTIIENVEANLNFANGDQTESLPEGYAARSVKIKKPENLTPENIAEGVEIAGIVGTHEGGCDHNIIEHIEIALDFSNGDQTETLPEGYSVHSATILKPDTLIAENIAEGVTIAGIVGTHKGGGGGADVAESYIAYGRDDSGNIISATFHNCTEVPQYMFYQNKTLQSVDFSGSPNLTSIGQYAFYQCTALTSITIPNSVTSLGYRAFEGTALTSITIPNSVTSLGTSVCAQCKQLTSANLPEGLTSIADAMFTNCIALTSITIPNSVTSIGKNAFHTCTSLKTVTLPPNLTSIGQVAFSGCTLLTSITIPNSVTSIGTQAFYNCVKLVEVINESNLAITVGAESYGHVAYYAKEVHTGASKIYNVDNYLFYTYNGEHYLIDYCGEDTELVLPNNNGESYEVVDSALYNVTQFKSVTIPANVTSIGPSGLYSNWLKNATFVDTSGWYVTTTKGAASGTTLASANLANTETAATYLKSTHRNKYWYNK